jgi:REP element-mobilizing transposase RayT
VKFDPGIHHRRSIRLKGYDYSRSGAYFVTIVTHERKSLFGEITNGLMILNEFGLVTRQMWKKLSDRFQNVELGAFVVMPNHIHGIILLDETRRGIAGSAADSDGRISRYAPTERQFGKMVPGSIPAIVRAYKSSVTYRINLMRQLRNAPVWQRNYYEHIVRDEAEANRIHLYIESNPINWAEDEENR